MMIRRQSAAVRQPQHGLSIPGGGATKACDRLDGLVGSDERRVTWLLSCRRQSSQRVVPRAAAAAAAAVLLPAVLSIFSTNAIVQPKRSAFLPSSTRKNPRPLHGAPASSAFCCSLFYTHKPVFYAIIDAAACVAGSARRRIPVFCCWGVRVWSVGMMVIRHCCVCRALSVRAACSCCWSLAVYFHDDECL